MVGDLRRPGRAVRVHELAYEAFHEALSERSRLCTAELCPVPDE